MTDVIAIGLGCRRGTPAQTVVALVRATLADACLSCDDATLFSIDAKTGEAGLAAAAIELGLPLVFVSREHLAGVETPTKSSRAKALFGVSSVAESAALAGAGVGAVLAVPRVARNGVTCAIAMRAR